MVAVVAPNSRSQEVEKRIGDNPNLLYLSWEQVREALKSLADTLDSDTAVLLRSLESFLQDRLAFLPRFAEWIPHLRRRFDPFGSPLQNQVVHKLREFFPYTGPRLSAGETWVGYYFPVGFKGIRGWFGFIPGDQILDGRRYGAELVVATPFDMNLPDPPYRPIVVHPSLLGLKPEAAIFAWAVEYDKAWATPEAWRAALAPIRNRVEQLLKDARASEEAG